MFIKLLRFQGNVIFLLDSPPPLCYSQQYHYCHLFPSEGQSLRPDTLFDQYNEAMNGRPNSVTALTS